MRCVSFVKYIFTIDERGLISKNRYSTILFVLYSIVESSQFVEYGHENIRNSRIMYSDRIAVGVVVVRCTVCKKCGQRHTKTTRKLDHVVEWCDVYILMGVALFERCYCWLLWVAIPRIFLI